MITEPMLWVGLELELVTLELYHQGQQHPTVLPNQQLLLHPEDCHGAAELELLKRPAKFQPLHKAQLVFGVLPEPTEF